MTVSPKGMRANNLARLLANVDDIYGSDAVVATKADGTLGIYIDHWATK